MDRGMSQLDQCKQQKTEVNKYDEWFQYHKVAHWVLEMCWKMTKVNVGLQRSSSYWRSTVSDLRVQHL